MTTIRPALMLVLLLLAQSGIGQPRVLEPLETLLPDSAFADSYATRQWSIATDINDQGYVLGYQLDASSQFRTYNIALQTNPAATIIDTPDFIGLSAGPQFCIWIICTGDLAFGIQIGSTNAGTNFVGGAADTNLVPGTLPLSVFPGDFVEENDAGIVISTQQGNGLQYGVIIDGETITALSDIPWLVDINDNVPAQILAYNGDAADCLVSGLNCRPEDDDDDHDDDDDDDDDDDCDGDRHRHTHGIGHQSHGRGYGYGHHCRGDRSSRGRSASPSQGALLLDLSAGSEPQRLTFPEVVTGGYQVSDLFPLALNQNLAVLRGTLTNGDDEWPQRLLVCQFNASDLDSDSNGVVDCSGGLQPAEAVESGTPVATVLGFSLDTNGLLVGNVGFTPAGIGTPALWQLSSLPAEADLLVNSLSDNEDHEVSVITATNNANQGVGYGYANCSNNVDAYRFTATEGSRSSLGFSLNDLYASAWSEPGQNYTIAPAARGGSGAFLFRYWQRRPEDDSWTLVQDWSDGPLSQTAGNTEEDICYRIELADANNLTDRRRQVLRFRVANAPASNGSAPSLPPADVGTGLNDALEDGLPIGGSTPLALAALLWLGRLRRRYAA